MNHFWSIEQFNKKNVPKDFIAIFEGILPYIQRFLCSPHPYRKGVVCPFVPAALKKDKIYFTYYKEVENTDSLEYNRIFIKKCIEFYLLMAVTHKIKGSLIILFPRNFDISSLLKIFIPYVLQRLFW